MTAQRETTHWTLYVDESGDLSQPSAYVVLAGVAVPHRAEPMFRARLKAGLKNAAPLVPWPPHRWLVTKAVMYPLWYLQHEDPELPAHIIEHFDRAIEIWKSSAPGVLANVRTRLGNGEEPTPGQLSHLRKQLAERDPSALEHLDDYSQQCRADIDIALRGACRQRPLSFLAEETHPGDAIDDDTDEERYFQLLVALLQRVGDALRRLDGHHTVTVHLAQRWAKHPDLPASRSPSSPVGLSLNRHHITTAASRVDSPEHDAGAIRTVRYSSGQIWDYDADVDPGIVIADFMANHCFRYAGRYGTRNSDAGLRQLRKRFENAFATKMSSGTPPLAHVTATGEARDSIRRARQPNTAETDAGRFQLDIDDVTRRWTAEHANQWIEYFCARPTQ